MECLNKATLHDQKYFQSNTHAKIHRLIIVKVSLSATATSCS